MKIARQIWDPSNRGAALAFLLVIFVSYVSVFFYRPRIYSQGEIILLAVLGIVYTFLGIVGLEIWGYSPHLPIRFLFYLVTILVGWTILYISSGSAWLLLLPLAGSTVEYLPRWGVLLTNLFIVALFVLTIGILARDLDAVLQSTLYYLAALVFVVVFAQLTVNEKRNRGEDERLALELGEANRKLREYALRVEDLAVAQERNRLAREIHDGLGHYLTAINMQIKAGQAVFNQDRSRALDAFNKAQTLTQEALADVRNSVASLRADPSADRPLPESLGILLEQTRLAGIHSELRMSGSACPLSPEVRLALYRCAQEGLTNVCKHAQATSTSLELEYRESSVLMRIQDNGIGADRPEGGYGLLGLRERVHFLGGRLGVQSAAGQGFILEVELPFHCPDSGKVFQ